MDKNKFSYRGGSGEELKDNMKLGGTLIKQQSFLLAESLFGMPIKFFDGTLGLGLPNQTISLI